MQTSLKKTVQEYPLLGNILLIVGLRCRKEILCLSQLRVFRGRTYSVRLSTNSRPDVGAHGGVLCFQVLRAVSKHPLPSGLHSIPFRQLCPHTVRLKRPWDTNRLHGSTCYDIHCWDLLTQAKEYFAFSFWWLALLYAGWSKDSCSKKVWF